MLADNGYCNKKQVRALEGDVGQPQMNVLVSVHAEAKQLRRKHYFRPRPPEDKKGPEIRSAFVREMKEKMARDESRENTACANRPSNLCSAPSSNGWGSGNSSCEATKRWAANGSS